MAKYFYPAIFEKEEVGYSVYFPGLDGCYTQGEDLEEAVNMAFDALGLYLEGKEEIDYPVPLAPEKVQMEKGQFVTMISFDKTSYDRKYNTKAIKKTLTLPAWLNDLAEKNHINFSSVLQNALKEKLQVED